MSVARVLKLLAPLAAAGAFVVTSYGLWVEPYRLQVRRLQVPIRAFRKPESRIRVLHVTDLHMRAGDARRMAMLQQLGSLRPDLLLITGDLIHGGKEADRQLERALAALAGIQPSFGAFVVLGNHDHVHRHRFERWLRRPLVFHDVDRLRKRLEAASLTVLVNEHARVVIRDEELYLVGVDDPFYWLDNVPKAVAGVPQQVPRLLLAHSPDVVTALGEERFDLILAGHTHGGQVRLGERIVWHTNTRLRLPRNAGLMELGPHRLYVSAGVGVSLLPLRLNCPPEVGWLELTAGREGTLQY